MVKAKLEEQVAQIQEELNVLEKRQGELERLVKKSGIFNTTDNKHELEIVEKELLQKQLILKEFKERLRSTEE